MQVPALISAAPETVSRRAALAPGWFSRREGDLLYSVARACEGKGVIVEIGSYCGKSTTFLAAGSAAGLSTPVYAIDPHEAGGTEQRFRRHIEESGFGHLVRPIVARSWDAAADFREPVEVLFIDGSHEERHVRLDWQLWFPKLVEGGWVGLHDTLRHPGPRRVADETLLRLPGIGSAGLADSICFGWKVGARTPADARRQTRLRLLKRIGGALVRMPMSKLLLELGGRASKILQG